MDPHANPPTGQQPPVTPEVIGVPQRPVAPARSRGPMLVVAFLLLALVVVMIVGVGLLGMAGSALTASPNAPLQESYHSLARGGRHKVAIINLEGMITDGEGFIKRQIDQVREDKNVKAAVLRVNSPGGTIGGSDYIYHHLREMLDERDIPLVVSMGMIAASGGYYVSMAVGDTPDTIFAEPTTFTGSIGVIMPHYDLSGLMDEWKISEDSISSHPLKNAGSFTKPMTPEEREIFQGLVNDGFERFKEVVKSGRPKFRKDPEALDQVATGQIFTTQQAVANGLVDGEGFIEIAIERAAELAGLDPEDTKAIKYKQRLGLFEELLVARAGRMPRGQTFDFSLLSEAATPRAYYLTTWLPGIEVGSALWRAR